MLNNQSVIVNVNTEPTRPRKSILLAYILFFIFGGLGGHRFYLGRPLSGFFQILLTFGVIGGQPVALGALFLWLLLDLFLIPGMARRP